MGNKRSDSTRASNTSSSFPPVVTQILWCPKKWCQLEQSWSGLVLLDQFRLNTGAFFALHQRLDFPKELQNFEIQQSSKICFPELILGKNNHLWKNNSSFVWTLKYYLLLQNSKRTWIISYKMLFSARNPPLNMRFWKSTVHVAEKIRTNSKPARQCIALI